MSQPTTGQLTITEPAADACERQLRGMVIASGIADLKFLLDRPLELPFRWQGTLTLRIEVPEEEDSLGGAPIAAHTVVWDLGVELIAEEGDLSAFRFLRPANAEVTFPEAQP